MDVGSICFVYFTSSLEFFGHPVTEALSRRFSVEGNVASFADANVTLDVLGGCGNQDVEVSAGCQCTSRR